MVTVHGALHVHGTTLSQCHTSVLPQISQALKPTRVNTCYLIWLENKLCPSVYQVIHIQVTKVKRFLI